MHSEGLDDWDETHDDMAFPSRGGGGLFRRRRRRGHASSSSASSSLFWKQARRRWLDHRPVALNEELRDVQLLALERRIRQSKCLLLFPVNKEDVDVMEHYFDDGYKRKQAAAAQSQAVASGGHMFPHHHEGDDDVMDGLWLEEHHDDDDNEQYHYQLEQPPQGSQGRLRPSPSATAAAASATPSPSTASSTVSPPTSVSPVAAATTASRTTTPTLRVDPLQSSSNQSPHNVPAGASQPQQQQQSPTTTPASTPAPSQQDGVQSQPPPPQDGVELHGEANPADLNQIVHEVSANVSENISRLRRVNLANGWDVGTTAEDMSDDLMLGLRFGFCGALSSFSSWNSAMINLIRAGQFGEAIVGYLLGLQLPIVAYRFGQHVAVYIFVWRCRQETKRDERRGYGIQLHTNDDDDDDENDTDHPEANPEDHDTEDPVNGHRRSTPTNNNTGDAAPEAENRQTPSIRAIVTVLFMMAVVTQCTSISFYSEPQNQVVALSLLFSPLGVLARWRLSKYNDWRPTFPIGTFCCNILACALSGGLGRLLAGNPNEEERLVLVSLINGFGGTLSSVANFIVEILAGLDPILFRFDGVLYALWSIFWAMVVGFVFSNSADWADETGS